MTQRQHQYNILVFGIEKVGLDPPQQEIADRNFRLSFETYNSEKRFDEFDGIILFQGIFETFKFNNTYSGDGLDHSYDRNELDKRKKELDLLTSKGGFDCFILHRPFIDEYYEPGYSRRNFKSTDLCKYSLNYSYFYRENLAKRSTQVESCRDEFSRFLELYGAASSHFRNNHSGLDWRKIAVIGDSVVGMVLLDKEYFIPSLVPDNRGERIVEYFTLLAEALTSSFNKLRIEVPSWVSQFYFEKESELTEKKIRLLDEIESVDNELSRYTQHKTVLLGSGEILVENIATLLRDGFSFRTNSDDAFREDLKIIDDNNDPIVLIEAKGTNRGVKREYINQTDSHRERAGLDSAFPSLLLINTHIKNSASIEDKDQSVPDDQVKHAVKMRVLILRTLDLLFLLTHMEKGDISQQKIIEIFCNGVGWLKVNADHWEIIH